MGLKYGGTGVPSTRYFPATHACNLADLVYNNHMHATESYDHPVCPKCESENVTTEYEPAEPNVGIMSAWVSFYCECCQHSWGCEPRECVEYGDRGEEPDYY